MDYHQGKHRTFLAYPKELLFERSSNTAITTGENITTNMFLVEEIIYMAVFQLQLTAKDFKCFICGLKDIILCCCFNTYSWEKI